MQTCLKRTLGSGSLVSALKRFVCLYIFKANQGACFHFDFYGELLIEDLGFLKFMKISWVHKLFEVQISIV